VKLKTGLHCGVRGVVESLAENRVVIRVEGINGLATVSPDEVTNFSLAARKAWLRMPKRQVGRPKGSKFYDRVSVTLRIDRDLWERFQSHEKAGLIEDRTATINAWLREKVQRIGSV
jgi:uncharacterized protein (DUF4415 family)